MNDLLFYRLADDLKHLSTKFGDKAHWDAWARRFSLRIDRTLKYVQETRNTIEKEREIIAGAPVGHEDWLEKVRAQIWATDAAIAWLKVQDMKLAELTREAARKECEEILNDLEEMFKS